MKITRVEIENYKSFNKTVISNLMDINMIYGYNNSGKSNILKFIELVFSTKQPLPSEASSGQLIFWKGIIKDKPFIFHNNSKNDIKFKISIEIPINEFKLMLNSNDFAIIKKEYLITNHEYLIFTFSGLIEYLDFYQSEFKLSEAFFYKRRIFKKGDSTNDIYFESASNDSDLKNSGYRLFENIMNSFNDLVLFLDNDRYFLNEKIDDHFNIKSINSQNLKNSLFQLSLSPEYSEIFKRSLKFISNFKVNSNLNTQFTACEASSPLSNIQVSFSKKSEFIDLMLTNKLGKQFPLESFGTGIQQIFYIFSRVYFSNSKIILVEELELNLSPKYQRILLSNFLSLFDKTQISQLIFTTHSKYFTFRNDIKIYEVSIDESGVSSVKPKSAVSRYFFDLTDLE